MSKHTEKKQKNNKKMSKHKLVFKIIALVTIQIFIFTTSASTYPILGGLSKVKKELRVPAKGEDPGELVESLGGNSEVTSLIRKVNKLSRIKNGIIAGVGLPDIHGRVFESDSQFFSAEGNFSSELEQFINTLSDKSVQETIHAGIMYYDIRSKFWKDNPAFTVAFALAFAKKIQQKTGKKDGIILHLGVDAYHKHFQTAQIFADAILRTGICDNGGGIYYWGVINGGDMRNYGQLYEAVNEEGANWVYFTMSHKTDDFLGAKMGINAQVFSGSEVRHCEGVTSGTLYDAIVEKDFVEIKHKEPVGNIVNIENFLANNIQVAADMIRSTSARTKKDIHINELLKGARLYVDMGGNPIGKNLVDILKALGADVEIGNATLEINYSIEHIIDPNEHRSPAIHRLKKIAEETGRVVLAVDPDGDRGSIVTLTSEGTALSMTGSELLLLTIENLSQNYHTQGKIATIISDMRTGTSAVDLEKILNNRDVPVKVIPQEAGYPFFMRGMASLPADVAVENSTHAFTNPMTNKNWGAPQDYKRHDGKGYQGGDNAALFLIYLLGCMVHQWEGRNPVEQLEWVRKTYDLEETFVDERKPKLPIADDKFKYMIAERMKVRADEWFKDDKQFLINFGNSLDAVMSGVHITKTKTGAMMLVRFSNTGASFTISGEGYSQDELNEMLGLGYLLLTTAVKDLHSGGHKFGFDVADAADLEGIFKLPTKAEKEKRYALDKGKLKEVEPTQEFIQDLAKTAEVLGVKSSTLLSLMQEGVRPEVFVDKLAGVTGIGQVKAALGAEKAFRAILSRYELGELKSTEAVRNPVPREIPLLTQEAARDYTVATSIKEIEFSLPGGDVVDKEKVKGLKKYHQGIIELTRDKEKAGEFSHRGNVKEYIKHFKKDVVPKLKGFINDNFAGDWRKVKYVVLSGIGGNEMSNHNLAAIQRRLVKEGKIKSGIEFYVLSNPAEMVRLPAEANGNNTIFIHMSRSGETGETIKTLEFLRERFPKCIICANKGPLQQLAKKFNLFNLPFGEDEVKIGGRMMRRKTITGYAALWLSLGGNEKYFDEYVKAADKCDNLLSFVKDEESLAVQMGEFLHSAAVLSGRPRLILMLNDDMTDERFTGEKQFLKHSLYELVQLWSEGYGKEDNYAPLEFINYSQDKKALPGIMAQADSCCGLVVLDRKNTNYREAKKQAKAMAAVMPLVIIEIEGMDFETAAALSSLYEDVITFMCTCENVDINANPGVKAVREESGRVLAGDEGKEAGIEEAAAKQIGEITTIGEVKPDASLLAFAGQIEGLAKSLKIDIPELLKIYRDSFDNYNLFLNILEKAGGMAYQRAMALLEANNSFEYVVKGYKEVRTERQAEKEREVPGQVQELVKEIQGNAGKYNISLELGTVKVDEEWLGERRKLHRGLREDDKDVLAQELAEFMDIAINTPGSKIGDIATVVSDIFQQDLGNKFKHSWMNSVVPAQDVFNELHIFTRASHHTFETILDNPEAYFFFGLVAQKQEAPEDRQDLEWLFEKVLEKDDVENPKHAGLSVGKMNRRLANANYTSLWRKGLPGLSIEFEKLTKVEEEKLGELLEKTAKHYRDILKEAELARWAGISELKGIIAEIVKKKEDGREKEELPAAIEEEVDSIINARRILPGLFTSEELEGVYSRDGKNIQKGRINLVLDNIKKLAELMKKKMPPASDLDYIIKNFVPAVEVLLENERMKKLANSEVDKIYLWLSGMVSNQLYKDIKKEQNERGKELYGKLKLSIAKLSKEKGEKEALKYALMYATLGNMLEDKYFSKEAVSDESFKEIEEKCLAQKDFFETLEENLKRLEELENKEKLIKYYIDNAGEFYLDLLAIRLILERGLGVVVLAQDKDVNNDDLSVENVMEILTQCLEEEEFSWLKEYYNPDDHGKGQLRVTSNNSQSYGVNLNYASAEHKKLRDNGLIIYKGGVNANYSTMMVEKINSFHLSALKQEEQKAIAYLLGFDKNKIIEGNLMFYQVKKGEKGPDLQDLLKAKDERSYFARKEVPAADFAKAFPNAKVKLNKEKLTEGPMAFIIDPALIGDNPSLALAIQNLKDQLGDKVRIVLQHSRKSEKLGAEALYEAIKKATEGTVDLKGKVDWAAPAKASPEEIIKEVQKRFENVGSIRVVGRQEWTKGFEGIERPGLEKITLLVCKIGEGSKVVQGDLAILLALKNTGVLPEKEMIELNKRWGKGETFFIVETKEIAEEMEYIEKYQEALKKFE